MERLFLTSLQTPSNIARLSHPPKITLNSVSVVAMGKDGFRLYSESRTAPKEQIIAISFVAISLVRVSNRPVLISQWPPGWMDEWIQRLYLSRIL